MRKHNRWRTLTLGDQREDEEPAKVARGKQERVDDNAETFEK